METRQREIKFRAWDGFRMYEPCVWMGKEYNPTMDSFFENHLMQYTGLKDKNGKEIYEGDIINYDLPGIDPDDEPTRYTEEVEFSDGQFHADGFTPIGVIVEWNAEVIGNLYENPELTLKP